MNTGTKIGLAVGGGLVALLGAVAAASSRDDEEDPLAPSPRIRDLLLPTNEPPARMLIVPSNFPSPGRTNVKPTWTAPVGGVLAPEDWIPRVLNSTSEHESGGNYSAAQESDDGQGLSYGLIQWTQKGGGLGTVLKAMHRANPSLFYATFGGQALATQLLQATAAASMAAVGGAVLWAEPWLSRFRAAGREPAFQAVQVAVATHGEHMQMAIKVANMLGIRTERAMAEFYNRAVHQYAGAERAMKTYLASCEKQGSWPVSPIHALAEYGWLCAAKFRRTSAPEDIHFNDDIIWMPFVNDYNVTHGDVKVRAPAGCERDLICIDGGRVKQVWNPVAPGTRWHACSGGKDYFDLWRLIIMHTAWILTGVRDDGSTLTLRDQDCDLDL